jgi:hypothetical protein
MGGTQQEGGYVVETEQDKQNVVLTRGCICKEIYTLEPCERKQPSLHACRHVIKVRVSTSWNKDFACGTRSVFVDDAATVTL